MKTKIMNLPLHHILLAAIAAVTLIAQTVFLFSFSYADLLMVFVPAAVGIVVPALLVLINRRFFKVAAFLSAIGHAAAVLLMTNHGVLPMWIVYAAAGISWLADLVLLNPARARETIRKFVVSLKRNPSMIPLAMLLVSFLLFSLNLTHLSDTTAKIQGKGMGLCQFSIMLLSILSMVCMLNAFPRRKKPNIPMIVLLFVMFGVIIYCNLHYCDAIWAALNRPQSPIKLDATTRYIADAYNMLGVHMVLVIITAALVALLPVYSKLLKKINTSVAVDDNGQMGEIEIED